VAGDDIVKTDSSFFLLMRK